MNNITQKNVIYGLKNSIEIPYKNQEFIDHSDQCDNINLVDVNNLANQLIDNDLYLENYFNYMINYAEGPKSYDEYTVSSKANGTKFLKDIIVDDSLEILHKVDVPLSGSVSMLLNGKKISLLKQFGDLTIANIDSCGMWSEDPTNGQWNKLECWLTVVDETNREKLVRSDVDIEDMYATENGCYFAANTGVYQLSAQYNETNGQSNVNYVLIKLNIDQTPINAKSIAVDTKNKKMYVGCKNSSLFLICDFFENAGAKNNEEKLRFFGQTLFNEHNSIVDTINDILILDDGNVIAAGDKALYSKSSFSNIQISKILKPTSRSAQFNSSIEFAGQLFFGTKNAGLWMLSNTTNELVQIAEIPNYSKIMKMVATNDKLYVATPSNIYSIDRVLIVRDQNFKNYGIITSMVVDQSFVIVSTSTGLWGYDKNINQPYVFQIKDIQANDIKDMLNVDGKIILASNNSLSSIGFSYAQNETIEVIKTLTPVKIDNIDVDNSGFIKFISAVGMQIAVFKTKLEVVQDSFESKRIMYFIENNADIVDAFVIDPILQDDSLEKYIAIATADKIEIVSFNGSEFTHVSETNGIKATRIAQIGTQILAIEKNQKTISACSTENIDFLHWVESDLDEPLIDLKTFVGISCACQVESGNVYLLEQSKIAQQLSSDLSVIDATASRNLSSQFIVLEDGQLCAITIQELSDAHTGETIGPNQDPEEYGFTLFETKIFNNVNVQKAKLLYFPNTDQHGLYIVDTDGFVQLYEISQVYLSAKNGSYDATKDDPIYEYKYYPGGYTLGNKIEITKKDDPSTFNVTDLKAINDIDENRIGAIFSNLHGVYVHIPHYGNSESISKESIKSIVVNDIKDDIKGDITYIFYTTGGTTIKKAPIDNLKSSSSLKTLSGASFSKLEVVGNIIVALNVTSDGSKLYLVNCEKTGNYYNVPTTGIVDFAGTKQYYDYQYKDTKNNKTTTVDATQSIGVICAAIGQDLYILVLEDDEELSNKSAKFDSTTLKETFSENIIGVDCIEYTELGFLALVYTATTLTICYCKTSIDTKDTKGKATKCLVEIEKSFEFTPESSIKQALFLNINEIVYLDSSNNLHACQFDDPENSTSNFFSDAYSVSIQNPRKLIKNIGATNQDVWCQTADNKLIKIVTQEYIDCDDSEINGVASIDDETIVIGTGSGLKKASFTFDVEATELLVKDQDNDDLVPWTGVESIAWTNGIVFGVGNLGGLSCVNTFSSKRQVVELDTRSFLKCYIEELDETMFKITAIGYESIFEKICSYNELFESDEPIDEPQDEFFDNGTIYSFQNIKPISMIQKSDLFEDLDSSQTIFEYIVAGASYDDFFVEDAKLYCDKNAVGIKLKQDSEFVANRFIANASDLDNILYLDVDKKTIKSFPGNSEVVSFNDEVDEVIQSNSNWHYKKNQNWFYLLDGSEYELPLIDDKTKIESLKDIATIGKIEYFGSEKGISKSDYWTTTTISQDEIYNLQSICTWIGDLQSLNFGTGEKVALIVNESQLVTNRKKILEVNLFTNDITETIFYPPNESSGQETNAIFEDIWIVNHDYQQGTYCKPYAINLEKSDYARWLNLVFNRNLIPYTGVLATGINQIDQYGDNNYILKDDQIVVFNGYRNSQAFSQISSSQFDGDNYYKSLIKTDDGVVLAASNKGMFLIKNLDVQLINQFENIGVVCKHKIENSTVYFYNQDSTILSSENYKIWRPLVELSSGTSKVFDILPFNRRKYLFATDIGLQGTDHKFSLVNDVKPMTKQRVLGLYDNLISTDFTSAAESCYQKHIDDHHTSSSTIVQLNNNYATTKLDNILSSWQVVQISTANQKEFGIKNDIINEMAFGSEIDGDVIVQISNYLDPADIQYMEEISNSTYITKRWMSGLTEVFINVPTTRTYYFNNMYGASNCTLDPNQKIYRENLVEFGTAKTYQDGQMSTHATTLQVGLASAEYSIDNLVDVQINGASLPLKIYQDANTGIFSDSEKMFKSFIEPSILKSFNIKTTDDEGNWLFSFQCFGTDAQAIHLMFYDRKAKQNAQKVKIVFMANGGEGQMSNQKFILVEDSDGNMVLEQKNLKRNRFINFENGNEKIFSGWSIKPQQENSNAQYENRELFPKSKKWKDLAKELGLNENQKLKNKDQITLYATWINYHFSDDDTAFVLNSNQSEFRIESIGVDEKSILKEKVVIQL